MKAPIFFLPVLAMLSLAACQRNAELDSPVRHGREITFTTSVGAYTKVSGTAFDEGDVVGLSISGPITTNNLPLTMTKGSLLPAEALYWSVDQRDDEKADFRAYYPYNAEAVLDGPFAFKVPQDQRMDNAYESADFLCAQVSSAPKDGTVNLAFSHIMSRFCVRVIDQMEGEDLGNVIVMANMFGDAVVDLTEGEATLSPNAELMEFCPMSIGENQYAAVMVPQKATPVLYIQLASGEFLEMVSDGELDFQPGKQIVANVVVTQGKVSFSAEIYDWIDEEIDFGPQKEIPEPAYFIVSDYLEEMALQEDGTFSVQFLHYSGMQIQVYDAVTGYEYGSAVPNSDFSLDMDESLTIPLIGMDVNALPIYVYLLDTEREVLNVVLDPRTWKLTISRIGEPEWVSIGTGKFLDGFMPMVLGVRPEEFDVEWEMDIKRPGISYRIMNPYANWSRKEDYGYEEGGSFNFYVSESSGFMIMNPSYTGLQTSDGNKILLQIMSGRADIKSGYFYSTNAYFYVIDSWQRIRMREMPAFFTLPDGNRPKYFYASMENITPGYDAESGLYYLSYDWELGFDLLNPRWLLYALGPEEEVNDNLVESLFDRLINMEGDVRQENFPYSGRWSSTTFVSGPGRYILAIYGPDAPAETEFKLWDIIEIKDVNE